ncbi:MAG: thioredoxin domain-containing protein [Candidatus Thorarchaeota archaeon]|nr:thioredoxin domain-containing protein [Candidatus Thorarchaeota archaeon]
MTGTKGKANRLSKEKSPYLLQHAYNPVDWYSWNDEAFETAKRENKPIFLSIGYSTCHWCHVMAHESFEDEEVASLMNDTFINIKVDREERPDIDKAYMEVAQMMTGRGGWPLTVIMTPDKKPFYAATYIPKASRYNLPGMLDLVPRLKEIWDKERENINEVIRQVEQGLAKDKTAASEGTLNQEHIDEAFRYLAQRFDDKHGGFGTAPKFPSPHNLLLLLRYWKRSNDEWALNMAEKTLQEMRKGGLFDHLGGGFHRYSTDGKWLLPHFEKMLYDQGMLLLSYVEAYQATRKELYAMVSREIIDYVLGNLSHPEGGFYSAEDADSEGVEGKFYVWSQTELQNALEDDEFRAFKLHYNVEEEGNFREEATSEQSGQNILHVTRSNEVNAKALRITEDEFESLLGNASRKLLEIRARRVRPHLDDKILTDWNGLFIAALAKAARILGNEEYKREAMRAAEFVMKKMRPSSEVLLHRYREGEAAVDAFLDDYAYLIMALIELYETTFDPGYLKDALSLMNEQKDKFWDKEMGGFFFSSASAEKLISKQKDAYDGAMPSGNSVSMNNLIRLARLVGDSDLEDMGVATANAFSGEISKSPPSYSFMLVGLDQALGPSLEVVIAGRTEDSETGKMLQALRNLYMPNMVVLLRSGGETSKRLDSLAPFTKYYNVVKDRPTAHICIDHKCKLPVNDIETMLSLIGQGHKESTS